MISVTIPVRLQSPNIQEHWSKKHKRNKMHGLLIRNALADQIAKIPHLKLLPDHYRVRVTITRFGVKLIDSDNVVSSAKFTRDEISSLLIPGLARGQADSDPRLIWEYRQAKGKAALKIDIELIT